MDSGRTLSEKRFKVVVIKISLFHDVLVWETDDDDNDGDNNNKK